MRNVVLFNGYRTLYLCDPYCWNTMRRGMFQLGYVFPVFQEHAYWQKQSKELNDVTRHIKDGTDKEAAELFVTKILPEYVVVVYKLLCDLCKWCRFPPIFHEWFVETFPEPSVWLASRLNYGRTMAVMSMVGFILGWADGYLKGSQHLINFWKVGRQALRKYPSGHQQRRRRSCWF